jgi:small-conductance mechanosensitive channel
MVHYAILLLGFFVALGTLGIDLTKITILAGAFTVGIGFGLKNVINNFVSGLILLFERPIKIGDVIEVSGNVGEVRPHKAPLKDIIGRIETPTTLGPTPTPTTNATPGESPTPSQ